MDLFDNHDDALVKYCLTLEDEQKKLRENQIELHQELIAKFQEENLHQRERFKFVLKQCKIQYDVWHYIRYLDREEEVATIIANLECDLEHLKSKWVLETSDNVFPGISHQIWSNQRTEDVYDSLSYHQYAIKLEAQHTKTRYFSEYNRDNPNFNPNLHVVFVSISVNPLTMSMIGEIIPIITTLKSNLWSKEPRLWSQTSDEWHCRVIFDLHFDKILKRRNILGRSD